MKKLIAALMALLLALTSFAALAEEAPAETDDLDLSVILSGYVLEVQPEYLLLQSTEGMTVQVNLFEDTAFEGADVAIGDFVHVTYNGMMTRSMPGQIAAMKVGCYKLQGVVSEMSEEGFLLTLMEESYYVHAAPEQMAHIADGMFVTVYYNGIMMTSLPAQVSADHIRGQEIVGVVTEMMEGGFILTVEGEETPYAVYPTTNCLTFVQPEPGLEIVVIVNGLMTASLESITVNAVELLPLNTAAELYDMAGVVTEIAEEYILIETLDGQQVQVNLTAETFLETMTEAIALGDLVHVTFDGKMTRSMPAQITALKIGCYVLRGAISDLSEEGFMLTTENDLFYVNIVPSAAESLTDGDNVLVYFNGAMTMSLPAQVGAEMIVLLSR